VTDWKSIPIGDLVETIKSWNPLRAEPDGIFDYIDLSSIDSELKLIVGARSVACNDAPSRARQLVENGDILVSTVRPNLNGVARVVAELDGATASTGFCVLRPRKALLDGEYLFQWVKSPQFVTDMVKKSTGASYPAVSDRIIFESHIPCPLLPIQSRIATIMKQADALRVKRREALVQLDSLAQSIFIEMFGDPLTNSKAWPDVTTLGEVAELVSGVTKGRNLDGKETRTVPYLAVANVQDKFLNLSSVKEIDATENEIKRYQLKKNDLLLTEGGDPDKLGRGTLWHDELPEAIHQNHIFRVRLTSNTLTPLFLNWLVGSQRGKKYFLRSAKQTTGIASINMSQLRSFPLLVPPVNLQHDFGTRIAFIEKLKTSHKASLAELDALFASLQHRAFSGQL
jgi:type I restriction enzyme S subunit